MRSTWDEDERMTIDTELIDHFHMEYAIENEIIKMKQIK